MLYILHQVNCQNAFGAGFAGYLNKVFPKAKQTYHEAWKRYYQAYGSKHAMLGSIAYAEGNDFTIVHCFGQEYYGNSHKTNKIYTDYQAIEEALDTFRAHHPDAIAICPYNMGCGLAGGDWNIISQILQTYNIIPSTKIDLLNKTYRRVE